LFASGGFRHLLRPTDEVEVWHGPRCLGILRVSFVLELLHHHLTLADLVQRLPQAMRQPAPPDPPPPPPGPVREVRRQRRRVRARRR